MIEKIVCAQAFYPHFYQKKKKEIPGALAMLKHTVEIWMDGWILCFTRTSNETKQNEKNKRGKKISSNHGNT